MSEEEVNDENEPEETPTPADEAGGGDGGESVPEFDEQSSPEGASDSDSSSESSEPVPGTNQIELNRFGGVKVAVAAQLGRADVTIKDLMSLSEGAVVELDRVISQPVELIAQGVPLGNGEVVVVDDRFAVRIKELY